MVCSIWRTALKTGKLCPVAKQETNLGALSIALQSRNQNGDSLMKMRELSSLWMWKTLFWWSRWCWYIEVEAAISAIRSILRASQGSAGIRSDSSHSSVFLDFPSTWMQGKGKGMWLYAGVTHQVQWGEAQEERWSFWIQWFSEMSFTNFSTIKGWNYLDICKGFYSNSVFPSLWKTTWSSSEKDCELSQICW